MKKTLLVGTIAVLFFLTLPLWNGTNKVLAMSNNIPIQGKLTDAGGNPLNGDYEIKATIYDADIGGVALCSDTDTIAVSKGLFVMNLSTCLSSAFGGVTQLYLGIQVGTDLEMTPRQPLYGTPFAKGLVNGVLSSGATSYLWVPGAQLIKEASGDSTRWDLAQGGSVLVWRGGDLGNKSIRIPIVIPVMYGQSVRVTAATIYYKCQNGANNYITQTYLVKNTDADTASTLFSDISDRVSNTATSYSITTDALFSTFSSSAGILSLGFTLNFINDADYIQIGGVRLTLDTN